MAAIDKLIERFKASPSDFSWDDLVRLLRHFGYTEQKGKGSRRKFKARGRATLMLHEPHPAKTVKQYMARYVRDTLEAEGLL
jgi:predicted RNA binding protein YcfA (HicA-like mRNA interferase family)